MTTDRPAARSPAAGGVGGILLLWPSVARAPPRPAQRPLVRRL